MKDLNEPDPEIARETILEIVENQIRNNDPPETKETLDRLIAEGIEDAEAKKMIACCVTTEVFNILKRHEVFNKERYIKNLQKLPRLPWE